MLLVPKADGQPIHAESCVKDESGVANDIALGIIEGVKSLTVEGIEKVSKSAVEDGIMIDVEVIKSDIESVEVSPGEGLESRAMEGIENGTVEGIAEEQIDPTEAYREAEHIVVQLLDCVEVQSELTSSRDLSISSALNNSSFSTPAASAVSIQEFRIFCAYCSDKT